MFQVKAISKDVRKTIVPSFMFLSNLWKPIVLCVKKMKIQYSFYHWTNQITNKYTWFSRKIFVLYRKWKIKNVAVLDVQSAAHLEAFLMKQGVLLLACLQCFRRVQRHASVIACLIYWSLNSIIIFVLKSSLLEKKMYKISIKDMTESKK